MAAGQAVVGLARGSIFKDLICQCLPFGTTFLTHLIIYSTA